MDAASDPDVETIVLMFASQTGKTSIEENIVGFHIEQDPSPILFVMPTLDMAQAFSKDRLAPMVRDTPVLKHKIRDARSRDSGNTLLSKNFVGGHITIAGANSPASLASRPIRLLLCDEVDRYPPSAGTEGDPVALATKRTTAFWNKKIILSATPTIKGFSRIEAAYEESDKRQFWVPCPHCETMQVLRWPSVKWSPLPPEEARYCCEDCGALWSDVERWRAVSKGEWRAQAEFNGVAGFHLNEIYSPWVQLGDTARNFLEAKPHQERLQVWVNTTLAETWEVTAEKVDPHALESRLEKWDGLPWGILVITAGVDVQADRVEIEVVGWGVGEESWSIEHKIIYGDPSGPDLWEELDDYLLSMWKVPGCGEIPISCVAIDTGYMTAAVADFVRPRYRRRIYGIKGIGGAGRPVWPKRASKNNKGRINLFNVGVDAAKDMIYSRLRIEMPGAGYCHFPQGRDAEYFRQLTSEKVVTERPRGGFPKRVWRPDPSLRNEALDIRVYAYAALKALHVNWGRLQHYFEMKREDEKRSKNAPVNGPGTPPRGGRGGNGSGGKGGRRVTHSSWMNR